VSRLLQKSIYQSIASMAVQGTNADIELGTLSSSHSPSLQKDIAAPSFNRMRNISQQHPSSNPRATQPSAEAQVQGIFVCFTEHGSVGHAIKVECLRPTGYRRCTARFKKANGSVITIYDRSPRDGQAIECDSEIFARVRNAAYIDQGWWRKLIPFFGIVRFEEVKVRDSIDWSIQLS